MFQNIFSSTPKPQNNLVPFRVLNGYDSTFVPYRTDLYDDIIARTCIDTVARHAAKLRPRHVRRKDQRMSPADSQLDYLLSNRPNEYMSCYDFLYKIVSQLWTYNNSLIYIKWDNGNLIGLYPLDYSQVRIMEHPQTHILFAQFDFAGDGRMTVPYSQLIHLRRHFNGSDIFGDDPNRALKSTLGLMDTCKQSIAKMVKNSARLSGLLKLSGNQNQKDWLAKAKKFANDFLGLQSETQGIAAIDSTMEFQQLDSTARAADTSAMEYIRADIYRYLGVSESIASGKYTEEDWQSFYESTIEGLAIQMGQEFTSKIFTAREQGYGNAIVFDSNRLQYASMKSKTDMIKELIPCGVLTVNDALEILNLPQTSDEIGDKRLQTLNYVNAAKADKYQGTETDAPKGGENENEGTEE